MPLGFLTARQNVAMALELDPSMGERERLKRAGDMLELVGIGDRAESTPDKLSGGQRQRVAVARALVLKPRLIVLDEPTAGVDVELRQTLWAFIARLNREGHTVLLTTHYLEEAEALCHRIAMLKLGRVVALDRTSNLLAGRASTMLRFKTDQSLPPDLASRSRVTGRMAQIQVRDAAETESVLAALRSAGVHVEDLEIGRADLEDVFLDIMNRSEDASGVPA